MSASYPTSVKTFVSRNAGDVIQPAHTNDLQDEVNAIETGLKSGLAHNLIWTPDATFDIGAVATGRPRDLNVSRNAVFGGNVTVTGDFGVGGNFTPTAFVKAWTAYTPAWTSTGTQPALGNGTIAGKFFTIGSMVMFEIVVTMGSTTTFGTGVYLFSLPAAAVTTVQGANVTGMINDSSTGNLTPIGGGYHFTATTIVVFSASSQVAATVPITFASADVISMKGFYEQ